VWWIAMGYFNKKQYNHYFYVRIAIQIIYVVSVVGVVGFLDQPIQAKKPKNSLHGM
jgi:hypothetical protein